MTDRLGVSESVTVGKAGKLLLAFPTTFWYNDNKRIEKSEEE